MLSPAPEYESSGDMYSLMASADVMYQQSQENFGGDTPTSGLDTTTNPNGIIFTTGTGSYPDFFKFIAYPNYTTLATKLVTFGETEYDYRMGYVNLPASVQDALRLEYGDNGQIVRQPYTTTVLGPVDQGQGIDYGVLGCPLTNDPSPGSLVALPRY